jgi:hypothetical protein
MKLLFTHSSMPMAIIYMDLKRAVQVPIKRMPIILCLWIDSGITNFQSLN